MSPGDDFHRKMYIILSCVICSLANLAFTGRNLKFVLLGVLFHILTDSSVGKHKIRTLLIIHVMVEICLIFFLFRVGVARKMDLV